MSGGCLEGFWMVSDLSWILPRQYCRYNNKKPFISLLYSTTVFPINALFNANINRFGGRLTVSEMCLDTAWWVIKSIGETPMKEYWALLISWFLFSKLPWIGHKVPYSRVSVGCQEGARGVSGVV